MRPPDFEDYAPRTRPATTDLGTIDLDRHAVRRALGARLAVARSLLDLRSETDP
jgi:hypothetical protein